MLSCESYAGDYVLTTPVGAKVQLRVECSPQVVFKVGEESYTAEVNDEGQLEVEALSLFASVVGTIPERYLFGVANFGSSSEPEWDVDGKPEAWGAEEGLVHLT